MDRPSSGELVAAHIRELVTSGEYRPGERIRQDEIASELGVSRIPVREAIIVLEREGWVTIEPHRGAFVNGLDADFIRDHFELHGAIVGLTGVRVVERADAAAVAEVVAAAAALAGSSDDPVEFNDRVYAWVEAVERAAAAPRLSSITRVMSNLYPGNYFEVPGAIAIQREGVAAITAAIVDRDRERVAAESERLLDRHGEALTALLEQRGVFDAPVP